MIFSQHLPNSLPKIKKRRLQNVFPLTGDCVRSNNHRKNLLYLLTAENKRTKLFRVENGATR